MSPSGHRDTAQNNLQLAEGWTSAQAEERTGRYQQLALQRPPEGTRAPACSLARSWGHRGLLGPQSRTCPGNCGLFLGERQSRVGMRPGSPHQALPLSGGPFRRFQPAPGEAAAAVPEGGPGCDRGPSLALT